MKHRDSMKKFLASPVAQQALALTRSTNPDVRLQAGTLFAQAISLPLREAIFNGSNIVGIFKQESLPPSQFEFRMPISIIAPGTEGEYRAYSIPNEGYIPHCRVEGDMVVIPTFKFGNSIDWLLDHAEVGGTAFTSRAMEAYEAGYIVKMNDDGWAVILFAGLDRNIVVYDADATQGQFTKRLLSIGKTKMMRNAGGNYSSSFKGRLTDMFLSVEGMEDIRNWNVDQVDEVTRREIYLASDDSDVVSRIFDVRLHPMTELGEGSEYQRYYTDVLGGELPAGDVELAVGLDLSRDDSFIMPVRTPVQTFYDDKLHRSQMEGYYGWGNVGFGAMDGRRVMLFSF